MCVYLFQFDVSVACPVGSEFGRVDWFYFVDYLLVWPTDVQGQGGLVSAHSSTRGNTEMVFKANVTDTPRMTRAQMFLRFDCKMRRDRV